MILALYSSFGDNSGVIWEFAGGVLAVLFTVAVILMALGFIRRLIDQ
jgi:hypothetical protein